ncbi:hypothetical protein VTJ04DRAFT_9813 [Mycothermus thermophilus]|uniref:uncharacterized protein n=1 Tax=Humicola insolens TaxID=85995 RepID=UPI0037432FC2
MAQPQIHISLSHRAATSNRTDSQSQVCFYEHGVSSPQAFWGPQTSQSFILQLRLSPFATSDNSCNMLPIIHGHLRPYAHHIKQMALAKGSASSEGRAKGKGRTSAPRAAKRTRSQVSDGSDSDYNDSTRRPRARKARKKSTTSSPSDQSNKNNQDSSKVVGTKGSGKDNSAVREATTKCPINYMLPPLSDVHEMFQDMVRRLHPEEMKQYPIKLNVATLCSGTDAPIFALNMIQEALHDTQFSACFEFEHLFSCEIEPFKQGFIRRNLPHGTVVFRDVIEMANAGRDGEATTAGGAKAKLPTQELDILFAGCSCVDYSNMNHHKPSGQVPALDKHLKAQPKKRRSQSTRRIEFGESPPIKTDQAFVKALDPGLSQLLEISNSESARTFFAAIKLITILRPKFVILENVYSAPWDMYTDQIFPKIGYAACVSKLDSKDFYLPQTRQRGYLVAVDAEHFGLSQAMNITSHWGPILGMCKRPPSSDVSAFLRPADDAGTILARADMEQRSQWTGEWALSSLRHADARHQQGLKKDDNPFSLKAMRNNRIIHATYPSHSWRSFWDAQPARIIDLMDIIFATGLKAGFDLGYKTYMIDASQNVDRNTLVISDRPVVRLASQLGIVGCITPSGLPVVTDSLRPVTGTETLALQGLPVDEMVLSTETQGQLRDLAGNAMTVTVVGAATLALLLAVRKAGTNPNLLQRIESATLKPGLHITPSNKEYLVFGQDHWTPPNDLVPILAVVRDMVRLCHCPWPAQQFFSCKQCGATACSNCRGNPEHEFNAQPLATPALTPAQGRLRLRDLVPMTIRLSTPSPMFLNFVGMLNNPLDHYANLLSNILAGDAIYYLEDIKVSDTVTICYKSFGTLARLVITPDSDCFWYIYIAPWSPERAELSQMPGFDLSQPVARGRLRSESLSDVDWSVWVLHRVDLTLSLAKDEDSGTLNAHSLTLTSKRDINPWLLAWKEIVEKKVHGIFAHQTKCGTPGNALHVKTSAPSSDRSFIMWDSGSLRDPSDDHFVWTNDPKRKEPHEHREIFLHATSALRWDLNLALLGDKVDVYWNGYWASVSQTPDVEQPIVLDHQQAPSAQIQWGSTDTILLTPCHTNNQGAIANMPVLATISALIDNFPKLPAQLMRKLDTAWTNGEFFVLPPTRRDAFLRLFAHIGNELRKSRAPKDLSLVHHLAGRWVSLAPCLDCAVTPPVITVQERLDQRKSGVVRVLIEDPDEAARFERQFLDLPNALAVAARLGLQGGRQLLEVRVLVQPKTLASRAMAYLRQAHPTASRGGCSLVKEGRASFTVRLDHADPPLSALEPFRSSVLPRAEGDADHQGLEVMPQNPPRFKYELRPSQKSAVAWMLERERAQLNFVKCEIEEEVVPSLGIRVLGKAEWDNKFPFSSRGGIVAHEIGYGKTVVTLAVIDVSAGRLAEESVRERRTIVDAAWRLELPAPFENLGDVGASLPPAGPEEFFIHLTATLIVVPKHIAHQWEAEAAKFLGLRRPKVLVITTLNGFYSASMKELRDAEIIIVSGSIFSRAFLDRLHGMTRQVTDSTPSTLPGRAREAWYRDALRHHRILTAAYLAGVRSGMRNAELEKLVVDLVDRGLPGLIEKQQAEINALEVKQVQEINRQTYKKSSKSKGNRTTENESEEEGGKSRTRTSKDNPWTPTCLHNCSFARIVWDEYTYDGGDIIHLFVSNAVANAKWLLSGTPELFTLEHVCRVAATFGIHLARPEPRMMPGLPPITTGPSLDPMTKSEEFHVFSSRAKSASLALERHELAHRFVATFFRANPLDAEINIEVAEQVIPITMSILTSSHYHMVNQELLDTGYDFAILPEHARTIVDLKGPDLINRQGREAAKMLLGLLANGLGRLEASPSVMTDNLYARLRHIANQTKLLFDKAMWLRHWVLAIMGANPTYKVTEAVENSMKRVNAVCDAITHALSDNGTFEDFGGWEMFDSEAATISGIREHIRCRGDDQAKEKWRESFGENWADIYTETKALYTWLDFFSIEKSDFKLLNDGQTRLLAEDLCFIWPKIIQHAPRLGNKLPSPDFVQNNNAGPNCSLDVRKILPNTSELLEDIKGVLKTTNDEELAEWMSLCAEKLPKTEKQWAAIKKNFKVEPEGNKTVKAILIERLTERNLKFYANAQVPQLLEMLCAHEHGRGLCENYRDGRAPPDRHRDMGQALAFGESVERQIDAANEELKRTMVHLFKTIEDMRATHLECNFAPRYIRVAQERDKEVFAQKKQCDSCGAPLAAASSAFLVVACGHFICKKCKAMSSFYCPARHCPAFICKRPVLRLSQIPSFPSGVHEPPKKADIIAEFIRTNIPDNDYVIVFAQYRHLVSDLAKSFEQAGIRFLNLAETKDSEISTKLEEFKIGKAGQVILLDMDSETSAGSNLTIATHLIFASPYVHYDPEHQIRTVQQARGRCIRTGQERKVNVYHFMVRWTVEEETLRSYAAHCAPVKEFFDKDPEGLPWWME